MSLKTMHPLMKIRCKMETFRYRYELNQVLNLIGVDNKKVPFITFNPEIKHQYEIRRYCSHDGTYFFSLELLTTAFEPLCNKRSYYKPYGIPLKGVKYTVGFIKRFGVFDNVDLPVGKCPGVRECVVIPVRCDYVENLC